MDTHVAAFPATTAGAVEAALSFLTADSELPYVYVEAPPPGVPARAGTRETRIVPIVDARPRVGSLSLDRHGFVLRPHATQVVDFYDDAEVRRVYYPEVEKLLRAETGASQIVIFDHTVRNTDPARQQGRTVREAGAQVHNDYTEHSAPKRVRDLLPRAEAEAKLARRYAEINVWRSIAGPVEAWPLALCEAGSLDWRDLVRSERRYADRIGETYVVRFNPEQRWFYFPRLRRDEALLLKCFDSTTDGRARLAVHSAFEDPTTRPDAPPRESIEVRAFAFF
jgi:hypothetical protein